MPKYPGGSIVDDVAPLEDFAELGPALSSLIEVKGDFRFLVTGSYLTFYRVSGAEVYIDRILYGRRDYLRDLSRSLSGQSGT